MPTEAKFYDWADIKDEKEMQLSALAPCAVVGMPNETYHKSDGVSKSGLDLIERSPYRYLRRDQIVGTDSQKLGSLRHTLVLEPQKLAEEYAILPTGMRNAPRDKAYKEWAAGIKDIEDRQVIKHEEVAAAEQLALCVRSHPLFGAYLNDKACGHFVEVSFYWRDPDTGLLCRARPDLLVTPFDMEQPCTIFDVKTMRDSSYSSVQYQGEKLWKWPKAAAFYSDGVGQVLGRPCDFVVVAVEYDPPYEVNLYPYAEGGVQLPTHQLGRKQYQENLERLARCLEADEWPTSTAGTMKLMELSHYALRELEQ